MQPGRKEAGGSPDPLKRKKYSRFLGGGEITLQTIDKTLWRASSDKTSRTRVSEHVTDPGHSITPEISYTEAAALLDRLDDAHTEFEGKSHARLLTANLREAATLYPLM